jgi:hypothetical protein
VASTEARIKAELASAANTSWWPSWRRWSACTRCASTSTSSWVAPMSALHDRPDHLVVAALLTFPRGVGRRRRPPGKVEGIAERDRSLSFVLFA